MKIKDLRTKTSEELDKELSEKSIVLSNLKLGISKSKSKNTNVEKNIKKEIAQILTIMRERI